MTPYRSIEGRDGVVRMLDQRLLPQQTTYIDCTSHEEVSEAIRKMVIRGAPAIGVAGAYGLVLAAWNSAADEVASLKANLVDAANILRAARPTAVNLSWAVDRVMARISSADPATVRKIRDLALCEANTIVQEDVWVNRQIGFVALPLVPDRATVIHHCNTGGLATVEYGTALGIIRTAHECGKKISVLVDETRPCLQGARLTAWELKQLGIPHKVIVDGASGHFMRTQGVDFCVVGCDRVAINGDTANKIGTYNLALAARAHNVPFYVAAPTSTIDISKSNGDAIPIEERPSYEVDHFAGQQITPDDVEVANPAFDITPADYITAIVTEYGLAYPPYQNSLAEMMEKAKRHRASLQGSEA